MMTWLPTSRVRLCEDPGHQRRSNQSPELARVKDVIRTSSCTLPNAPWAIAVHRLRPVCMRTYMWRGFFSVELSHLGLSRGCARHLLIVDRFPLPSRISPVLCPTWGHSLRNNCEPSSFTFALPRTGPTSSRDCAWRGMDG